MTYVDRPTCVLPEVNSDQQILPLGQAYACPVCGVVWVIVYEAQHGGSAQPIWAAFPEAQPGATTPLAAT